MVTLEQLVYETIQKCGKKNSDVLQVYPNDPHFPTEIIIEFNDGTEAVLHIDTSGVTKQ